MRRIETNKQKALEAYKNAHALNPLPMYLLIIIELESSLADSTETDSLDILLPPSPVTLEEIFQECDSDDPDMTPFSDAPAFWLGTLTSDTPIARDGSRSQYIIAGTEDGQDFVASLPAGFLKERNLNTKDILEWQGRLQGFKIVNRNDASKILPVLVVDEVE